MAPTWVLIAILVFALVAVRIIWSFRGRRQLLVRVSVVAILSCILGGLLGSTWAGYPSPLREAVNGRKEGVRAIFVSRRVSNRGTNEACFLPDRWTRIVCVNPEQLRNIDHPALGNPATGRLQMGEQFIIRPASDAHGGYLLQPLP